MEEEDDDFYGTNGDAPDEKKQDAANAGGDSGSEQMDEDSDHGDDGEEDSDDDSIQIELDNENIVEQVEQEAARRQAGKIPIDHRPPQSQPLDAKPVQAASSQEQRPAAATSTRPVFASSAAPAVQHHDSNLKSSSSYPPVRSSNIDFSEVAMNPPYPPADNKPIRDVDLDADIADKPWRVPGVDQSEWFNYGFDEFTWATYVLRQKELRGFADTTSQQMKDQFGMMGLPVPGAMPGAPGGGQQNGQPGQQSGQQPGGGGLPPGMPSEQEMQQMMAQMQASGMDISQMGFEDFMRMGGVQMPPGGMGGMGGMNQGGQQPQAQQQQQWNQGSQYGGQAGRGGRSGGRRW